MAFGYAHLIDIFEEYRKKNHNVELILELDDHLTNLNENNVDIALRVTATPPQNYAARKLSKISWLYCASLIILHGWAPRLNVPSLQAMSA